MSDLVGNPEDRFSRVAAQLWSGVESWHQKLSMPLDVVLQEERRLIPQHQIWHIVGQIKELSV